jgi:hypothetical protein
VLYDDSCRDAQIGRLPKLDASTTRSVMMVETPNLDASTTRSVMMVETPNLGVSYLYILGSDPKEIIE